MVRIGLVGLVIGSLLLSALLYGSDGDPTVLLAVGEESASLEYIEDAIGRSIETRPSVGHDGKFFFVQALDPLYLGDTSNARYLDWELYRGQRMFFPLLIGLGGLAPAAAIPWLMVGFYILFYGIGTAATARLAEQQGGSPMWGLAFPLNVALIMSIEIGGAGVLALTCALLGTAALGDGRTKTAAVILALSVLTREIMLLYVAGIVLHEWWRTRRPPFSLALIPGLSFVGWYVYMLNRLEYESVLESNGGLDLPFRGLISAASSWGNDPKNIISAVLSLTICAALIRETWRRPTPLLAGTAGFTVLALLVSDLVWLNWFDITRGLAPIYTTFIVAIFARPDTEDGDAHDAQDPEHRPREHVSPATGAPAGLVGASQTISRSSR